MRQTALARHLLDRTNKHGVGDDKLLTPCYLSPPPQKNLVILSVYITLGNAVDRNHALKSARPIGSDDLQCFYKVRHYFLKFSSGKNEPNLAQADGVFRG